MKIKLICVGLVTVVGLTLPGPVMGQGFIADSDHRDLDGKVVIDVGNLSYGVIFVSEYDPVLERDVSKSVGRLEFWGSEHYCFDPEMMRGARTPFGRDAALLLADAEQTVYLAQIISVDNAIKVMLSVPKIAECP